MGACKWLEVLHSAMRNQLQSKEDCLVMVFHCILINKGNKCVGIGDSWDNAPDISSDLLPENWNSNQENYSIRYAGSPDAKYLMKIIKSNDSLLVNVLDVSKEQAAGMSIKVGSHINDDYKTFSVAYKNLEEVEQKFTTSIFEKLESPTNPDTLKSNKTTEVSTSSLYEDDPNVWGGPYGGGSALPQPARVAFPSVGRADLDPLGGFHGGGGMMFDPRSMTGGRGPNFPDFGIGGPGGLPRGSVPPGARFDPFGPPMPGRGPHRAQPDPDDLAPPGFSDSFM